MAYNQQNAFWDLVQRLDPSQCPRNGDGVDHHASTPNPWAPFGQHHHFPHPPPPPPPAHGAHPHPHPPPPPPNPFGFGFPFHHGPPPPHGGPFGGGPHRGGRHGHGHGRRRGGGRRCGEEDNHPAAEEGESSRQGQGQWGGSFDLNGLLAALASHPLAQPYRQFFEQAMGGQTGQQSSGETAREVGGDNNHNNNVEDENTFTPPIDIFTTETQFVLHVALPGAKKEDVGINWDSEKGVLNIAGVIYRQGDEEFLRSLTKSERKVGVFERAVRLPPVGEGNGAGESEEKDEIDGDGITAKLEDGVLVVRVPKVEREWTDVKKVDIQ